MKINRILLTGAALLPLALSAAPATKVSANRSDQLLRQELKQERIGATLDRVASQIKSVITEYQLNGLEGDDLDTLVRFHGMLGQLSDQDVAKIVKQLGLTRADGKTGGNAFGAFYGQKQVIVKLEQIYLEWQTQQIFR